MVKMKIGICSPIKAPPHCWKSLTYYLFKCHNRNKKDAPRVIIMYYLTSRYNKSDEQKKALTVLPYRPILTLMGQKTISWCLTSFHFLAYDLSTLIKVHVVFIFLSKIWHCGGQNSTLEWIKVGNDMMSDTTNVPSNWELVIMGYFSIVQKFTWLLHAFCISHVPNVSLG